MRRPRSWLLGALLCCCAVAPLAAGTLSERSYKKLSQIHELIGAHQYQEALRLLGELRERVGDEGYEYATVMQTLGYAYAATEQYQQAVAAFRAAIDAKALPDAVRLAMTYNLAQLHLSLGDTGAAARAYEDWFATAEKPSADSFVFAAGLYAQMQDYAKAIPKIKEAIALSDAPKESWYQLLLSMYYEQKQYGEAAQVLETLVGLWPDEAKYWRQLSSVYFTLHENEKSLALLELARQRGFLTEEAELLNLVALYLYAKIPYKAARLLENEMQAGRIARDGRTLQRLADAWTLAREQDRALGALTQAAQIKRDGKLFLRAAQLHLDQQDWKRVLDSAQAALAAGDLDAPGQAYLMLGMANAELKRRDAALAAFRHAEKFDKSRNAARQWIAHLQGDN